MPGGPLGGGALDGFASCAALVAGVIAERLAAGVGTNLAQVSRAVGGGTRSAHCLYTPQRSLTR